MRLLLASKSSARRRLLTAAQVRFETMDAPFDEDCGKADLTELSAPQLAAALAEGKALSVGAPASDLVLGSDQTLERDDSSILSKARTREELAEQLRSIRGRSHRLHSAAAIVRGGEVVWRSIETVTLTMRDFSDDFLSSYLDREFEEVRWSVGGYHIEGRGVQLFERIEGSHFAILGLPLLPLLAFLRTSGFLQS